MITNEPNKDFQLLDDGDEQEETTVEKTETKEDVAPKKKESKKAHSPSKESEKKHEVELFGNDDEKESSSKTTKKSKDQSNLLKKEVTIKLNPLTFLKWGAIIVLLILVFFLGRASMDPICDTDTEIGTSSNLLNSFLSIFSTSNDSVAEDTIVSNDSTELVDNDTSELSENSTNDASLSGAAVSEPPEEEVVEEEEPEEEKIVTTYNKVSLKLLDLTEEWYSTWGKIIRVKYTITNNEGGTIEPDHFVMMVEGYGDFAKEIPLAKNSKQVKSGKILTTEVIVPKGFAYNPTTIGSLTGVDVTLIMYDSSGKDMASVTKAFTLEGN